MNSSEGGIGAAWMGARHWLLPSLQHATGRPGTDDSDRWRWTELARTSGSTARHPAPAVDHHASRSVSRCPTHLTPSRQ